MTTLNQRELLQLAESLQKFSPPLKLQGFFANRRDLVLEWYHPSGLCWLWCDLNPKAPVALLLNKLPVALPKGSEPLRLFFKAHLINQSLEAAEVRSETGRILYLRLRDSGGETSQIEIRLFAHGQNFIVKTAKQGMAWKKPQPLKANVEPSSKELRSPSEILSQWSILRNPASSDKQPQSLAEAQAKLEQIKLKKQKAIAQVQIDIANKQKVPWRSLGEWLSAHQTLDVPTEFLPYVDHKKNVFQNRDQCFAQAKEQELKLEGAQLRLSQLQKEYEDLLNLQNPLELLQPTNSNAKAKAENGKTPERKGIDLGHGVWAEWGKSGADNLRLLRASKAWDLWVHIKDYPGSHGIIHRLKNQQVGDELIRSVGSKLLAAHLRKKGESMIGEKFELLVTECRFVRPIKGDRLGRVTYQNERVLSFKFAPH